MDGRRDETIGIVKSTAKSLLGADCQAHFNISLSCPYVRLDVPSESVAEYLKNQGLGTYFIAFRLILAREVDCRLETSGTEVGSDGIIGTTYRLRVYPGGEMVENPYL